MAEIAPLIGYDPDISRIHEQNFDFGWKDSEFIELLDKNYIIAFSAKIRHKIQSFIVLSYVSQEAEILTLATAQTHQRQGLARALLDHVIAHLKSLSAETLLLEVAVDNPAALALYNRMGFEKVGKRKSYYSRRVGRQPMAMF